MNNNDYCGIIVSSLSFLPWNPFDFCLLDSKDDVKEEARRGLRFTQASDLTSTHNDKTDDMLPVFPELVSFVAQKVGKDFVATM